MTEARRYIRLTSDKYVYPYTSLLADRTDMIECDVNGTPVGTIAAMNEAKTEATATAGISVPTGTTGEPSLERMSRAEIIAVAQSLGLKAHHMAKDETIIAQIRAVQKA